MSVLVVEGELAEHLEVGALTVVETSDERLGDEMCVFVAPRHGQDASNVRYLRTCPTDRGGAVQKAPERVVEVDEVPATATGAIRELVLRKLWAEKFSAGIPVSAR
ncbi:hypothetical protein BH93_22915 [Rhodococcoides fascians A25f]|nr:hypothetical protein BH93_22915 [Rhodococcus fascians A25f]